MRVLVYVGFLLWAVYRNWRDIRACRAMNFRWTVRSLTRKRAVTFIISTLLLWVILAFGILDELSDRPSDRSVYLLIPIVLGLQICLFRRTEIHQAFGDADHVSRLE